MQANGTFTFRISSNHSSKYDPFCVNSRVRITAEVEEAGRGTKQSDTVSFPLVVNPVRVKLADDNPQLFRAGLNYTLKVCVGLYHRFHLYCSYICTTYTHMHRLTFGL